MAERVGFEPTVRFPARSLSRRVLSTAQSPLRGRGRLNRSRALRFSARNAIGRRGHRENREVHEPKHALVAACSEERLNDGGALGGEDAGRDFYLMV